MSTVSIIIPIYNGEKYINKGIHSILEQDYRDIEIIFVNDGSSDNSEEVINNIIKHSQDEHVIFKYIFQENAGIAMARNKGLDEASGKYVMFMDQDDWLESDYIKTFVAYIEESESDLVIGGFKLVDSNGKIEEEWNLNESYEWSKFRITAPWGRIFRKELIDKYHLRFMNTKISEDLYFNILCFSYTSKIKVISYAGYNWYHNTKSESRTKWNVISKDRNPLVMLEELHRNMKQPNAMSNELLTYFFAKYIFWYLLYSAQGSPKELFISVYKQCIKWLNKHYPEWSKGGIKWKNPGGEVFKTHMTVVACVWLYKVKLLRPALILYSKIRIVVS